MMDTDKFLDFVIFAQELRLKLFATRPPIIRSRRQLFRLYEKVFLGRDLYNWAVENEKDIIPTSLQERNNNAVAEQSENVSDSLTTDDLEKVLQSLVTFDLIHSVHGDIPFKADNSLFRFAGDDMMANEKTEAFVKGYQLFKSCQKPDIDLVQKVFHFGVLISDKCMRGNDLLSWLIEQQMCVDVPESRKLVKAMLKHKVIKPVLNTQVEFEEKKFYMFEVDFSRDPLTMQELSTRLSKMQPIHATINEHSTTDSQLIRRTSGSLMGLSLLDIKAKLTGRTKVSSISSLASDDSGYTEQSLGKPSTPVRPIQSYENLLNHDGSESFESLLHPDSPFERKEFRIYPDAVGYGFIIRGSGPCFVKLVDSDSPAGKAGLKAFQFISEINGRDVLKREHVEIEDLILSGPKYLRIGLMCPAADLDKNTLMKMTASLPKALPEDEVKPEPLATCSSSARRMSFPVRNHTKLPTAQPWMYRKSSSEALRKSYY